MIRLGTVFSSCLLRGDGGEQIRVVVIVQQAVSPSLFLVVLAVLLY